MQDEKTLEWAKKAIVPFLVVHQGYNAKGPKDLPLAKTFGIWLPEDDGLSISDTLTLVSVVMQNQLYRFGNKAFSEVEPRGATFSIRSGTFANHTEGTELQPIRWLSAVQFQKKKSAKQFQNLETSLRSPKGDENL